MAFGSLRSRGWESVDFLCGVTWKESCRSENEDREKIRNIDFVVFVGIEQNSRRFAVDVLSVANNCVSIAIEIDTLRYYEGALWVLSWKNGNLAYFWA